MSIVVEHRPDQLLQENVGKGCPPGLEQTFVGLVTVPTHEALLNFLNEQVVGQDFEDKEALQGVLDTWPTFAEEADLSLHRDFSTLGLNGEDRIICGRQTDRGIIVGGPGGPLVVAISRRGI